MAAAGTAAAAEAADGGGAADDAGAGRQDSGWGLDDPSGPPLLGSVQEDARQTLPLGADDETDAAAPSGRPSVPPRVAVDSGGPDSPKSPRAVSPARRFARLLQSPRRWSPTRRRKKPDEGDGGSPERTPAQRGPAPDSAATGCSPLKAMSERLRGRRAKAAAGGLPLPVASPAPDGAAPAPDDAAPIAEPAPSARQPSALARPAPSAQRLASAQPLAPARSALSGAAQQPASPTAHPTHPADPCLAEAFRVVDRSGAGRVSRKDVVAELRQNATVRSLVCRAGIFDSANADDEVCASVYQGTEEDEEPDVYLPDFVAELSARRRAQVRARSQRKITRQVLPDGEVVWLNARGRVLTRAVLVPMSTHPGTQLSDVGTSPDPMVGHPGSVYLAGWYVLQSFTSILCYAVWMRHRKGDLGTGNVYTYASFLVLGCIVFFGVVATLLYLTLSPDMSKSEVRQKRYFAIALLWVCQDLALFTIEFNAMLKLGVEDFFQGLSLVLSSFSGIFPPWWVWARVASDWLQDTYHRDELPEPMQQQQMQPAQLPQDPTVSRAKTVVLRHPTVPEPEFHTVKVHRFAPLSASEDAVTKAFGRRMLFRDRRRQRVRLTWDRVEDGAEYEMRTADSESEEEGAARALPAGAEVESGSDDGW
eukprot:TRINITY_DN24054_c0_g1_i2.p1 TRINITY_DN24054_c0_g1~~TRINITY_DN24054_c0_g1_i2.p1  ORF type:complete len:665 (+),score=222.43 TRINITY_DN24054_c0_g1_i2:50-1996(+)